MKNKVYNIFRIIEKNRNIFKALNYRLKTILFYYGLNGI